ncbi:MAG: HAD-IA family hydrolase [Candidatus Sulfotelmatobacter sp.]
MEAIIFDFDFTLVDSSQGIVECVGYALQELGLPIPPAERVLDTIGLTLNETLRCLTGQGGSDMTARFTRCFHHRADQVMDRLTTIYEGVPTVMQSLRRANIPAGVVSTKLNYRIRSILKRNDLEDFFDVIVGADNVASSKPDPEGLLFALRSLGVNPSAALYVGDHIVDAEAAERAEVGFVAVLSGRHPRNQFEKVPHAAILETVRQLPVFLGLSEKVGS